MYSRIQWTKQEEEMLKCFAEEKEIKKWARIAEKMNIHFADKLRTGKQCRERYINYVKFSSDELKNQKWTAEEEIYFLKIYALKGSKWMKIAEQLPGKSENSLKNKFYGLLRRLIRRVNKVIARKKNKEQYIKALKYQSLIRVLEAANETVKIPQPLQLRSEQLRENILQLMVLYQQKEVEQKIMEFSYKINEYWALIRHYRSRRPKKLLFGEVPPKQQKRRRKNAFENSSPKGKKSELFSLPQENKENKRQMGYCLDKQISQDQSEVTNEKNKEKEPKKLEFDRFTDINLLMRESDLFYSTCYQSFLSIQSLDEEIQLILKQGYNPEVGRLFGPYF